MKIEKKFFTKKEALEYLNKSGVEITKVTFNKWCRPKSTGGKGLGVQFGGTNTKVKLVKKGKRFNKQKYYVPIVRLKKFLMGEWEIDELESLETAPDIIDPDE